MTLIARFPSSETAPLSQEVRPAATWVETNPGHWTVTLGHESRAISHPSPGVFIAWIGHQDRHWCFARALRACVEDIEYRLFKAARVQQEHEEGIAALMRMTVAERSRFIASLEAERDLLDYADSEVNVTARKAQFDRQISTLRAMS